MTAGYDRSGTAAKYVRRSWDPQSLPPNTPSAAARCSFDAGKSSCLAGAAESRKSGTAEEAGVSGEETHTGHAMQVLVGEGSRD